MGNAEKWRERNSEVVAFFYLILGNRIHRGMDQDHARKDAYDAVFLRYGIGRGRFLNILSERNYSHHVNDAIFREDIAALAANIEEANAELESVRERNGKLLALLKDFLENDR